MILPILDSLSDDARAELEGFIRAEVERLFSERALLTVAEFAQKSGLTEKSVRHRIERGQLQHVRNGGRLLIPASELRPR